MDKTKNKIILVFLNIFTLVLFSQMISAAPLWSVASSGDGTAWGSATCDVAIGSRCPVEMGWPGNTITYKFNLPSNVELSSKLVFVMDVNFRNYGTNKNVILSISAGSDTRSLKLVNPNFEISRTGSLAVEIDSSLLKKGSVNYIKIVGVNVNPTGYGTNPPNFQHTKTTLYNGGSQLAVGDIDKDGVADLITQDYRGEITVKRLNSQGGYTSYNNNNVFTSWMLMTTGDVNKDGIADIIFQESGGKVAVWLMHLSGTMSSSVYIGDARGWMVKASYDLDKDGIADILFQEPSGKVAVWFMKSDGTMNQAKIVSSSSTSWKLVGAGNLIQNNSVSNLLFQEPNGAVAAWTIDSQTNFISSKLVGNAGSWNVKGLADINKDGIADIVYQEKSNNAVAIWFMNSDLTMNQAKIVA